MDGQEKETKKDVSKSLPTADDPSAIGGRLRSIFKNAKHLLPLSARFGRLDVRSEAHVGPLVDCFAAFAMLDEKLSPQEADLILDMLRSAFAEVDQTWLKRRLRRSVRQPKSLQLLASSLHESLDDNGKLVIGLELFTLVSTSGRYVQSKASFEVFMRRLGRPDFGSAIIKEMSNQDGEVDSSQLPFERLIFGGKTPDISLPPAAGAREFRIYRAGNLLLLRNIGPAPLILRGKSLSPGGFMRIRQGQEFPLPAWTLRYSDLIFFLDIKKAGHRPTLFIESGADGLIAERARSRESELCIRFGLEAEVEVLARTDLQIGSFGYLKKDAIVECKNHERIGGTTGASLTINDLRQRVVQDGRRFRIASEKQEYLVSNDPAALDKDGLLIGAKLAPRTVLYIKFNQEDATGELEIREAKGSILVDGQPVRTRAILRDDSLIRLSGNQAIRCRFSEGFIDEERTQIESLHVDRVIHDFGKNSRALDQVNFAVERGEMLCIIGPSGSGKSTLLKMLSGQMKPTRGRVKLNGISLYSNRKALVKFITYMPQEEALNAQLTVREHLRHGISIRRPGLQPSERDRRVDSMLAELGLQRIARRRVGAPGEKSISGGERSRLNLGVDLSSRAEVFLFDEPISGLSSKDSEHVAETLRELAREKIVIASLHRPGASVLRLFDKVLMLDSGGKVAFFGTPLQMVTYFRNASEELEIAHPAMAAKSPLGADFVFDILEAPLTQLGENHGASIRRFPPNFWQERFESRTLLSAIKKNGPKTQLEPKKSRRKIPVYPTPVRPVFAIFSTFLTHFQRSLVSKVRTRGTLYSTFLEAPVLAALIAITLRSSPEGSYQFNTALHIPAYIFLSVTVAMFLGLTNSATEILRDRPVLRRERNCHPGGFSYVSAKFLALAIVAGVQCFFYLVVGNHFLEIEGVLLYHWIWMTLTALTGTAMALLISSFVKSERAALTAVPLLLVPQMLLAGALVPFKEMNRGLFNEVKLERDSGGVPVPAMISPLRYAFEGMLVSQATRNPFELERIRMQRKIKRFRDAGGPTSPAANEQLEIVKEGLRRLSASGARDKKEASELVARIRRMVNEGSAQEVSSMKIWPDEGEVKPTYTWFLNDRIELAVREAETFRNDYRNKKPKHVFLALEKPIPFYDFFHDEEAEDPDSIELPGQIETMKFAGIFLIFISLLSLLIAALNIRRQNRKVS